MIARPDGTLLDVVGSGEVGSADGGYAQASFDHPQGMAVAEDVLYVADTENHLLRARRSEKAGRDHAGRNRQTRGRLAHEPAATAAAGRQAAKNGDQQSLGACGSMAPTCTSPWPARTRSGGWPFPTATSGPMPATAARTSSTARCFPTRPTKRVLPRSPNPADLAADDTWLYVADSEGSSIRAVPFDPAQPVRTVIGTSQLRSGRLFTFGDVDGRGAAVRLQHPLGVAQHNGQLYVADTYNNKIKVIDLADSTCQTLAGAHEAGASDDPPRFDEPAGLSLAGDRLYVADTNNHAIRVIDLAHGNRTSTLAIAGLTVPRPNRRRPNPASTAPAKCGLLRSKSKAVDGKIHLHVRLQLPAGYKINESGSAPLPRRRRRPIPA